MLRMNARRMSLAMVVALMLNTVPGVGQADSKEGIASKAHWEAYVARKSELFEQVESLSAADWDANAGQELLMLLRSALDESRAIAGADGARQELATLMLEYNGTGRVALLKDMVIDDSAGITRRVARALTYHARAKDDGSLEAIEAGFASPDARTRQICANATADQRLEVDRDKLGALLLDENAGVRKEAVNAVRRMKLIEFQGRLKELAEKDSSRDVRATAARALKELAAE